MKYLKIILFIALSVLVTTNVASAQSWAAQDVLQLANASEDTLDKGTIVKPDTTTTMVIALIDSFNAVTMDSTTDKSTYLDTIRTRLGSPAFLYGTPTTSLSPTSDTIFIYSSEVYKTPILDLYRHDAVAGQDTIVLPGTGKHPVSTESGYAFGSLDSIRFANYADATGATGAYIYGKQALGVMQATEGSKKVIGVVQKSSPTDSMVYIVKYGHIKTRMECDQLIVFGDMLMVGGDGGAKLWDGQSDSSTASKIGWFADGIVDTALAVGTDSSKYIFVNPR